MRHLRREKTEARRELDASAREIDRGEHRTADALQQPVDRLGVGVVVEDRAHLEPAETVRGDHTRIELVGVAPRALRIDDAGRRVEAGASALAEVAFVEERLLAESLAGEREVAAIDLCRARVDVVEAALRVVARLGVVELDALHAVFAQALPHREHVVRHALVRQVVRHVGTVVHVLALDVVRGVEDHPVPVRDREVVAGHSHLDVGVRDAVPRLDRGAPLGERLVGRAEVSVLRPVRIVVPALLRVAVVMITVEVGLKAHAHLGVLRKALLVRHVEFLHERGGVVDVAELAERAHGPAAEEREVVDVRVRAVRLAHGASVRLGGRERIVGHRVDVERIGGEEPVRAGLHEHAHLVGGVERERTVVQLGHLAEGVVLETARDERAALAID